MPPWALFGPLFVVVIHLTDRGLHLDSSKAAGSVDRTGLRFVAVVWMQWVSYWLQGRILPDLYGRVYVRRSGWVATEGCVQVTVGIDVGGVGAQG